MFHLLLALPLFRGYRDEAIITAFLGVLMLILSELLGRGSKPPQVNQSMECTDQKSIRLGDETCGPNSVLNRATSSEAVDLGTTNLGSKELQA
jgi:hypothetical protein